MATKQSHQATGGAAAGADFEAAAERIRGLNERILESASTAGEVYLNLYERSLENIAQFQERAAQGTDNEWVTAMATAQANFTRDLASAYSSAARTLLRSSQPS